MSRDILIATVTTIIFVSSIGGALWYGGYTTTLAKLASLEELLPSAEPPQKTSTNPTDHNPPPTSAGVAGVAGTDEENKESDPIPEIPTHAALPSKLDQPKETNQTQPAVADTSKAKSKGDDLFGDMALPALDGIDAPASPAKPAAKELKSTAETPSKTDDVKNVVSDLAPLPAMPEIPPVADKKTVSEQPAEPTVPAPPPAVAKDETKETRSDDTPPSTDLPPVPPVVSTSASTDRSSKEPAEKSAPSDDSAPTDSLVPPPPPTLADKNSTTPSAGEEPATATGGFVPPAPVIAGTTPEVLPVSKSEPAPIETPASPVSTTMEKENAVAARAMPISKTSPSTPSAVPDAPSSIMDEPKTAASSPRVLPAKTSGSGRTPVNSVSKGNRSAVDPLQETTGDPSTARVGATSSARPDLSPAGEVIARAQPTPAGLPGVDPDSILSRAEPIARAAAPVASAAAVGAAQAVAAPTKKAAVREDEFVPLHQRGNRYAAIGMGNEKNQPEEFYAVNNLPSGSNLAYGETTVVSRKAGSTDVPQVVSYDVSVYLALDGDTYESIAQTMYKSPGLGESLARFNGNRASSTTTVPVGSRVRIPPAEVLGGPAKRDNAAAPAAGRSESEASREAFKQVAGGGNYPPGPRPNGPLRSAFDRGVVEAAPPAPANPGEYRAEKTETLWAVAAKTLGDGRRWREIYDLNKDRLPIENQVAAGTLLRLPKATP
jgi:hypothetical protein